MSFVARAVTAAFVVGLVAGCASTPPNEPPAEERSRGFKPWPAPQITDSRKKEARDARLRAARATAAAAAKKAAAERPALGAEVIHDESAPGGEGVSNIYGPPRETLTYRLGCARDTTERARIDYDHRVIRKECISDDGECSGPAELITFGVEPLAKKRCQGGRSVDCRIVSKEADRLPRSIIDEFFSDCAEPPAPHSP